MKSVTRDQVNKNMNSEEVRRLISKISTERHLHYEHRANFDYKGLQKKVRLSILNVVKRQINFVPRMKTPAELR